GTSSRLSPASRTSAVNWRDSGVKISTKPGSMMILAGVASLGSVVPPGRSLHAPSASVAATSEAARKPCTWPGRPARDTAGGVERPGNRMLSLQAGALRAARERDAVKMRAARERASRGLAGAAGAVEPVGCRLGGDGRPADKALARARLGRASA